MYDSRDVMFEKTIISVDDPIGSFLDVSLDVVTRCSLSAYHMVWRVNIYGDYYFRTKGVN